jgi:hypothetical protein
VREDRRAEQGGMGRENMRPRDRDMERVRETEMLAPRDRSVYYLGLCVCGFHLKV